MGAHLRLIIIVLLATSCGLFNESPADSGPQPEPATQIPVMPPEPSAPDATPAAAPAPAAAAESAVPDAAPAAAPDAAPAEAAAPDAAPAAAAAPDAAAAGEGICAAGRSEDPPATQLEPTTPLAGAGARQRFRQQLQALLPQYPHSATLRVRAGLLASVAAPRGDPAEAQRLFEEALRLHAGNCRLAERDEWDAIEGLGVAAMLQSNYAAAQTQFEQTTRRWPTIPQSFYNLACARCRLNQLEPCHAAFVAALRIAAAPARPAFIGTSGGTVGTYVQLSRNDPDLALLRADPRYQTAIARYAGQR